MDEIKEIHFQIPPSYNEGGWYQNRVQFLNHCFSLNEICYISPVNSIQYINYFYFEVKFCDDRVLKFEFPSSTKALKAQRELSRAWTRTGEYSYEKSAKSGGTKSGGGEVDTSSSDMGSFEGLY